jgi:hypothetical protein
MFEVFPEKFGRAVEAIQLSQQPRVFEIQSGQLVS